MRTLRPLLLLAIATSAGCRAEQRPPATADTGAPRIPVAEGPLMGTALPPRPTDRAVTAAVQRDTTTFGTGPVVVRFASGDSLVVADSAVRAWRLQDGAMIAWSGLDGAGGYENEGQSVWLYTVATGRRMRVLADYFQVEAVETAGPQGQLLAVTMIDGGQGSLHVAVVDADRGAVFRATNARVQVAAVGALVESFGDGDQPVTRTDRRPPLRVDTVPLTALDTMPLVMIPRSGLTR